MKILQNMCLSAVFSVISLGMYAAAPEQTKPPQREEWQQEAEAFLQGLHPRMGAESLIRTELGEYPTKMIAKMLKTGGHFTNNTNKAINMVSLEVHKNMPPPASESSSRAIFNGWDTGELKPGQSFRYDYVKTIHEYEENFLKSHDTWISIDINFKGDDFFQPDIADHVILDWSSNITIEDTKDGLRLIVKEANESKPPAAYELKKRIL